MKVKVVHGKLLHKNPIKSYLLSTDTINYYNDCIDTYGSSCTKKTIIIR